MAFSSLRRRTRDAVWALRHRYQRRHRYNLVETGLAPGYYDEDTRMLHACMMLLCEHIEHGHGGAEQLGAFTRDLREDSECRRQADHQSEALAIYRWWKVDRPANHKRLDEWCMRLFSAPWERWTDEDGRHCIGSRTPPDESIGSMHDYWAFEAKLGADDQQMLHRLIDIRQGLWA